MATWAALAAKNEGDQWNKDDFNQIKDNFDFLRTAPQFYSPPTSDPNITTTSTTFVDLTGFSLTHVSQGGLIEIAFVARVSVITVRFDFLIDGVSITGDNDALGAPAVMGVVSILRYARPAAGSRQYKVQWRTTSGTGTVYPAGLAQFMVRELTG